MRFALALTALLALAACGGDETKNVASPVAPAPAPSGQAWVDVVAKVPDGGYVQGNPNAPIKLIEYGSRNCPVCGRFAAEGVEPLRAKYISTGKVSYEFRDFMVHGGPDLAAALLNQCVPTESFFNVLDQLFAGQEEFLNRTQAFVQQSPDRAAQIQNLPLPQQAPAWAEVLGYIEFMKQRGVPDTKAKACLADQKQVEAIAKINAKAVNDQLPGTPTFLINGKIVPDTSNWARLEPALIAAGAR